MQEFLFFLCLHAAEGRAGIGFLGEQSGGGASAGAAAAAANEKFEFMVLYASLHSRPFPYAFFHLLREVRSLLLRT